MKKTFAIKWETMDGTIKISKFRATSRMAAIDMLIAQVGAKWIGNIL